MTGIFEASRPNTTLEVSTFEVELLETVAVSEPLLEVESVVRSNVDLVFQVCFFEAQVARELNPRHGRGHLPRAYGRRAALEAGIPERDRVPEFVCPVIVVVEHPSQLYVSSGQVVDDPGQQPGFAQVLRHDELDLAA